MCQKTEFYENWRPKLQKKQGTILMLKNTYSRENGGKLYCVGFLNLPIYNLSFWALISF